MPNAEKVEKVAALKHRIEGSEAMLLADYRGLTVADAKDLRSSLREAGAAFSIVKNTLMKRAAGDAGLAELESMLEGPTAVAFVAGDPVLAAKRISEAAKRFPSLALKGGYMEGRVLTAAEATALASLDSREVMLSKLAGMAKSEMQRAASMIQALQSRFVGLLEAFREKVPGEAEAAPEAETAPEAEAVPETAEPAVSEEAGSDTEAQTELEAPEAEGTSEGSDEQEEE